MPLRPLAVLLALLLLVPTAAAVTTATEPKPSVDGVEVTPNPALVGEPITVAPTISNDVTASGDFVINAVALRTTRGDRLREYTRISDVGTITPGGSARIPFELSFANPGTKRFQVVVFGEDENGNALRLRHPVSVEVRDEHPDVRVRVDRTLTAGVTEGLNVTVSNGFEREIRSVSVDVDNPELATAPTEAGTPRIAAGGERTFDFTMRADGSRSDVVEFTVSYRTTTGFQRELTTVRTFEFEPLREDVTLNVGTPAEGELTVPVTIGNFGNGPIENVVVRADASNGSVPPVTAGTLKAGSTKRVELRVSSVETYADLDITATYEVGGETKRRSTSTRITARGGEIELTGLDVERTDGRLHVVGNAANIGLEGVDSVLVRVADAPGVEPAPPNREYFVGSVPASDFVSFDVYATVDGNVSEIPLVVTYLADGERRTVRTSVPYDGSAEETPTGNDAGSESPLIVFGVGGLAVLAVAAIVVVGWQNRGG